jgi:hypothetical protein
VTLDFDRGGLNFIDDQVAFAKVVAKWDHAAHPDSPGFRQGDLVADALAGYRKARSGDRAFLVYCKLGPATSRLEFCEALEQTSRLRR